jgi:large subunit ribosomal protein L6
MSRIGKHPVPVPSGVTVAVDGQKVTAKGKLGELFVEVPPEVAVRLEGDKVVVAPRSDEKRARAMWGMARSLVANTVKGVAEGFTTKLEISGVGYRAAIDGRILNLQLGFSHDIKFAVPEGIKVVCDTPTAISISGADRQRVGQIAAEIRRFRGPEPYKGKGVRYAGEKILRKEGKKK